MNYLAQLGKFFGTYDKVNGLHIETDGAVAFLFILAVASAATYVLIRYPKGTKSE